MGPERSPPLPGEGIDVAETARPERGEPTSPTSTPEGATEESCRRPRSPARKEARQREPPAE